MCLNPLLTYKDEVGKIKGLKEQCKTAKNNEKWYEFIKSENIVEIKCGKCKECLKEKMLEMKTRLEEEIKNTKNAYFLTLTYDEEHKKELNKRDIQLFIKRYRKKEQIRYFYVGELGETTKRQHYHAIIFGNLPKDLKESNSKTKNGYNQYDSEKIKKLWGNGLIKICKIQKPLISYIVKYMLKSQNKKEFICGWSKNPPIGINLEKIEENIKKNKRTKALKKYYKNHYGNIPKNENEEEQQKIKIQKIEKELKMPYYQYIKQKRGY